MNYYILKDKEVFKTKDVLEWARWFETGDRTIKKTILPDGKFVSTVFLGIDHSFGMGKPLIFETMVFSSKDNFEGLDMDRYSTYDAAEKGHEEMVKKWTASEK